MNAGNDDAMRSGQYVDDGSPSKPSSSNQFFDMNFAAKNPSAITRAFLPKTGLVQLHYFA
jgi:hypothetical protein